MTEPSVFRLNLLRCGYLFLILGLGSQMAPPLIARGPTLEVMHGVVLSMLCALGLLSILGLRYPLKMLPLLFFEMTWKLIWLDSDRDAAMGLSPDRRRRGRAHSSPC